MKTTAPILIILSVIAIAFLPVTKAVSPPPDGGYPGGNTAEGANALFSLTSGGYNTAVGFLSLRGNSTSSFNTGIGAGTLLANVADQNTATGAGALLSNTIGNGNTANGAFALFSNTTGSQNTANGDGALFSNTTGSFNTATGLGALKSNTTADNNTADGINAMLFNTTGTKNAACGGNALLNNTTGSFNTAIGFNALVANTDGYENIAVGDAALGSNTDGINNTAVGAGALTSNTIGSNNIVVGHNAGANIITANGVICIGSSGAEVDSTTWIDNIYGVTTQNGTTAPVVVSADGQLGTVASSERFKKDVATMDDTSTAILSLRPVTFHYKTDPTGTPQFGLIAEEVAKVNPALVLPDKEGKPYTVRYDAVNAMLLNEFLKEHKKLEEQQATIAELKSTVTQQQKGFESKLAEQENQIEALTAGLQKVSAQLELGKPAPQTVLNHH